MDKQGEITAATHAADVLSRAGGVAGGKRRVTAERQCAVGKYIGEGAEEWGFAV